MFVLVSEFLFRGEVSLAEYLLVTRMSFAEHPAFAKGSPAPTQTVTNRINCCLQEAPNMKLISKVIHL